MTAKRSIAFSSTILNVALILVLILGAAIPTRTAHASTVFYAMPGGAVSGACTSWATACELRYALAITAFTTNPRQIWVAAGTYRPTANTDRNVSFQLWQGQELYGGFVGNETSLSQRDPAAHPTVLSGNLLSPLSGGSYHVVTTADTGTTVMLDGFTVSEADGVDFGGGMLIANASPTIRDVNFQGNLSNIGGGLAVMSGSPSLTDVSFTGNYASLHGGGIYVDGGGSASITLNHVTFNSNQAYQFGGGISNYGTGTLTNVTFQHNSSGQGGALASYSGTLSLTDVTFIDNSAGSGAAIYNQGTSISVMNTTFSGNSATVDGGAIYNNQGSATLTNVTFRQNTASHYGGAFYDAWGSPVLNQVTFSGNTAVAGGALFADPNSQPVIRNGILWGDNSEILSLHIGWPAISYSIVAGGCPAGSACTFVINADPKIGPLQNNGGLTQTQALGAGSAAIDKCSNATRASTDQRGVPRPQGAACDMGAYEVRALTFVSAASYDGWVLESSETSGIGGSLNTTATTLRSGDDASNRQIRSILSFNTASLPDAAAIVLAKVQLRKQGITGDPNPFSTHGSLLADLAKPYFGAGVGLAVSDFQAAATVTAAGRLASAPAGSLYSLPLSSAGRAGINRTGTTHFRLRFTTDDDNDSLADYVSFFSGNYLTAPAYRPKLVVYYNP